MTEANIPTIAYTIQLAVAPVFLLAGIGGLLNVVAHRLARVVDRLRSLECAPPPADAALEAAETRELSTLGRRMLYCNWAIGLCTAAALLICLVVVILFVSNLAALNFAVPVSLLFIGAMGSLVAGLLLFLAEVRASTRMARINDRLSQRRRRGAAAP